MPHKSIGYTINHLIIYPLIVSFLIIAATISFSLFAVDNQRVEKIKSNSYDFQKFNLRDIARVIGFTFQNYTEDILNDVASFNSVLQSGYNNIISLAPSISPSAAPSYYINALTLSIEGLEGVGTDIPGYDTENEISVYRPMWFIDRDTTDLTTVPDFLSSYENFILGMPVMFSLYTSGKYSEIYSVTQEQASEQRKLVAKYPLDSNFDDFVLTLIAGPWWNLAMPKFTNNNSVALIDPYYIKDRGYVYTACIPIYMSSTSFANISVNCANYDVQLLMDSLQNIDELDEMSYFVIDQATFNVILHPNLENVTTDSGAINITQAEFGTLNTSTYDATNYTAKLTALANSLSSTNYYMEYTKDGVTNVLTLIQVLVPMGNGQTYPYLVGVSQSKSYIYSSFSNLGDAVTQHWQIQLIGVCSIIVLLLAFYFLAGARIERLMSRSIKDLIKFGQNIDAYWNTESKEFTNITDQTQLSFDLLTSQTISKNFTSSKEVQLVHDYFLQVMQMVQCTKEAQHASTDAEALSGYYQAVKIYEKINHTKGLSIAYSNIARLQHQNNRLEEAIINYQKAIVITRQEISKLQKVSNDWKLEQLNVKKVGFLRRKVSANKGDLNEYGIAASLTQMQRDMKHELTERIYEFGQCLIQFGKKAKGENKKNNLEKIKAVFIEVIRFDKELKESHERILICQLMVSNVYIEQNDLTNAVARLDQLEDALKEYKVDYEKKNKDKDKDSERTLFIPPGIFRQNLMFQRALYYKKLGLVQEAFKAFTDTLEMEKRFDPHIRRRCLLEIESILDKANLLEMTPNVTKMLEGYQTKGKDIIVLLDCSQSMGQGARLRLLVKNILKLYDSFLRPQDRMGYITFHLNCDIVFALTEKKKNTNQLRKLLEAMPRPSGGTALYTAIYEAIKLLCKAEPKNHTKWVVVLTDGDDTDSRISFEQIYRRLARSDVNLLIMGLALHQSVTPKMSYLCKSTKGGVFVESQSEEKIDEAFNMITSIIYGQEFESEEITFEV